MRAPAFLFALAIAVLLPATPAAAARALVASEIRYTLRHAPGETGTAWVVDVEVRGIPADAARLTFELSGWGGAADAPGYLEALETSSSIHAAGPGRFEALLGDAPHGVVAFRYALHLPRIGSAAQRARGLLATHDDAYAFGYSWSTLVQVFVNGEPLAGKRTLTLLAPRGTPIITGWAGRGTAEQRVVLDAAMGNAPLAFGRPTHEAERSRGRFDVEVYQFGSGRDATPAVADVLIAAGPVLARQFGTAARDPYRAFITDHAGGGMGSHFGLRIGFGADQPAGVEEGEWFRAFVLHEFVHDWLGQQLVEDDSSLVWFKEGFTEYLALWTATSTGLVSREWFARRLLELESIARTRSALGQVAFGDPTVSWRDGDGPLETLAYTGAPLLALLLDVELREARRPGLPALVRDLLRREDRAYGLTTLATWFADAGLGARWQRSVLGTELPSVRELLERAGYRISADGEEASRLEDSRALDRFFAFRP